LIDVMVSPTLSSVMPAKATMSPARASASSARAPGPEAQDLLDPAGVFLLAIAVGEQHAVAVDLGAAVAMRPMAM
jgi:hypothetical protein